MRVGTFSVAISLPPLPQRGGQGKFYGFYPDLGLLHYLLSRYRCIRYSLPLRGRWHVAGNAGYSSYSAWMEIGGRRESISSNMSFNDKRRGRGRDKRDRFGDDNFGFEAPSFPGELRAGERSGGGGFGGPRGGGGGGFGGGAGGGGFRGGGAPRGPAMPAQVVGEGKGVVKFFNNQKGFGFIQVDDRPDDVFVHISAVEQAGLTGLAEGQPLEFTLAVTFIGFGIIAKMLILGIVCGVAILWGSRYLKRGAKRGAMQHMLWALGLEADVPLKKRFPPSWDNDFIQ